MRNAAVLGAFPLAFAILAATKVAFNQYFAAARALHQRIGSVDPALYYQDLLDASRSSLMILAMACLSLLVFVVACFLPIGAERK